MLFFIEIVSELHRIETPIYTQNNGTKKETKKKSKRKEDNP